MKMYCLEEKYCSTFIRLSSVNEIYVSDSNLVINGKEHYLGSKKQAHEELNKIIKAIEGEEK